MIRNVRWAGALAAALALAVPAVASADPALSVAQTQLDKSLTCSGPQASTRVLLLSGTTITPAENYSWNMEPALTKAGFGWCAVTTPAYNLGDIQVASEYVAAALRRLHAAGAPKLAVVSHDQGALMARWALRFWPGTRTAVSQVISIGTMHHGSVLLRPLCIPGCAEALWQMLDGSNFIRALNSPVETFPGISYTQVYTRLNEIAQPNLDDTGTSSLRTGRGEIANIATQDICPLNVSEHLLVGTSDPVSWAIVSDALTHGGVAKAGRIDRGACGRPVMPGVDLAALPGNLARTGAFIAARVAAHPFAPKEPALACYVADRCPHAAVAPKRCAAKKVVTLRVPRRFRKRLRSGTARVNGKVVARFGPRRLRARATLRHRSADVAVVKLKFRLRGARVGKQTLPVRLCR